MELIDSHAHLMDEMYSEMDIEKIINNAHENDVAIIINIGYDKSSSIKALEIAENHKDIYAVVGLHPDECNFENIDLDFIKDLSNSDKVVGIGEIGLDYHYDSTNKENQIKHFISQIELANTLKLPTIIHSRDADMDMLKTLKEHTPKYGFVMHCFSSSVEIAKEVLKLGGYISLAGTVTFKNANNLLEVAKLVPDDKLLVETDCPYLSPEPKRGRLNEPANVKFTAQKIAELKNISLEELAKITTANAKRFYKI